MDCVEHNITITTMSNFFDRFKPKDSKKSSGSGGSSNNNSASSNAMKWGQQLLSGGSGGGFQGAGATLGGKKPGKIIPIQLNDPGPLGVKVEKRPGSNTAIISTVIPNTQAARAGLQRGDIVCFQGSDGGEEVLLDMFLELAKSNQRPLCFDVRRVETKASSSSSASAGSGNKTSAEAYARKQAMIAAAEKRERAAKQKAKPIGKGGAKTTNTTTASSGAGAATVIHDHTEATIPQTEASRQAARQAKNQEAKLAAELGYNPYETNKVTAGQARNATTTVAHGEIGGGGTEGGGGGRAKTTQPTATSSSSSSTAAPGVVRPPTDPTTLVDDEQNKAGSRAAQPPAAFEHAFETAVTSGSADHAAVVASFAILRKLIVNATTKGQQQQQDDDGSAENSSSNNNNAEKFRRVRLTNPKIKAAVVDVEGALDIMMSVGFELTDNPDDGESYLVYPGPSAGGVGRVEKWLPTALERLEQYEKSA